MSSLREQMPVTAWLVAELRRVWSVQAVDALVRASMQGQGSMATGRLHAVETGPDGVQREFGQRDVVRSTRAVKGAAWSR